MQKRMPAAARLTLACALAALVLAPGRGGRHHAWASPTTIRRARPEVAGPLLRHDEGRRPEREPDHDPLGLGAPDDDPRPGRHRRTRSTTPPSRRRPRHARALSRHARGRSPSRRRPGQIRRLDGARRARVPGRSRTSSSATSRTSRASGSRSSTRNGKAAACAAYEPLLAASYDALKAVDRTITVIGVGLGPRGNDNPLAPRATSRSRRCAASATWARAYRAQQADAADHGRAQLPPVPEPVHGQARDRLPVAERGHPEPRAHQAGRLGRVLRHRASRRSRRPACRSGRRARSSCG